MHGFTSPLSLWLGDFELREADFACCLSMGCSDPSLSCCVLSAFGVRCRKGFLCSMCCARTTSFGFDQFVKQSHLNSGQAPQLLYLSPNSCSVLFTVPVISLFQPE